MRNLSICSFIIISIVLLLNGCSTHQNSLAAQESAVTDYRLKLQKTVNKFRRAVTRNDSETLYELVDLNYEGEVYWSEKEAQDLIDFFNSNHLVFKRQLRLLQDNIDYLELLEQLHVDSYNEKEKRIPYAPIFDGFVFLQLDGQLAVNVTKHTIRKNVITDNFDELVIEYEDTDEKIAFQPSTFQEQTYKNHSNEEVVGVLYVGPGNYTIHATLTEQDHVKEAEVTIDLEERNIPRESNRKNEQAIRLSFN